MNKLANKGFISIYKHVKNLPKFKIVNKKKQHQFITELVDTDNGNYITLRQNPSNRKKFHQL